MMPRFSGNRLRTIREQAGYSQAQLAEAIGRSHAMIGHWETDRREPSLTDLRLIADVLRVPISVFFEDENHVTEEERALLDALWKRIPHERRQLALRILQAVANFDVPDEEAATLLVAS